MDITIANGKVNIASQTELRLTFIPAKVTLLPVINRGREYAVPQPHLGKPIDSSNVIEVAELGVKFYESFIADAELFLGRSST